MRDILAGTGAGSAGQTWEREQLLESLESYRRGLSDAPLLRKWSGDLGDAGEGVGQVYAAEERVDGHSGGYFKAAGDEPLMTFVISSEEVDRHGDVVMAQGWRLAAYRRNPVFLWAHDYTRPVIGRAMSVWSEAERLLARMEFAPTDFAREVAALYRSGYQQGVSVGFKPLRYEERRQEQTGAFLGIRFLEQELLEVSAVPVPANRQALRRARYPDLEPAPRVGDYLYRAGCPYPEEAAEPFDTPESPSLAEMLAALRLAVW